MKPFKIAANWIDYAHGPGAEDGQVLATKLIDLPYNSKSQRALVSVVDPVLVAEIADVAELYIGDDDEMAITARRAFSRSVDWLRLNGIIDWRSFLKANHKD